MNLYLQHEVYNAMRNFRLPQKVIQSDADGVTPTNPTSLIGRISRRKFVGYLLRCPGLIVGATVGINSGRGAPRVAVRVEEKPLLRFDQYGECDGVTDDSSAFVRVLKSLSSAGGGTVLLPPKKISFVLKSNQPMFTVPPNVRIEGSAGETQVILTSTGGSTQPRIFAKTNGDNIAISGLRLYREEDFPLVFFQVGAFTDLRITRCRLDGKKDRYPKQYAHGVSLDSSGAKSNIKIDRCSFTQLSFGLFQANSATGAVDNVAIDRCQFFRNHGDDLCFNAPKSVMRNIEVTNSDFRDNLSKSSANGFGVSLAHVVGAHVDRCHFENYYSQAIHIEDYSSNIKISDGTTIKSCGRGAGGGILIISGSSDITIAAQLDQTANSNALFAIAILAGNSGGTTAGGRPEVAPSRVTITPSASVRCGATYQGIFSENATDVNISAAKIIAAGSATGGTTWDSGSTGAGLFINGQYCVSSTTLISGFKYGIKSLNTRSPIVTRGQVRATISNCYVGILNPRSGAVDSGHAVLTDCVVPLGEPS